MIILKIIVALAAFLLAITVLMGIVTQLFYWYEQKNNTSSKLQWPASSFWRCCWSALEASVSLVVVYCFYPFAFVFNKPLVNPAGKKPPLILVHGLYHNSSAWGIYRCWLNKAGYGRIYSFTYPSQGKDIWELTSFLERAVSEVEALYPGEKPLLLGMSLGGLLIRAWLCQKSESAAVSNQARIRGVVSMGTPHSGSKLAAFALERTGKSLLPSSAFLSELRAREEQIREDQVRAGVANSAWRPKLALYSLYDNMVMSLDNLLPPLDWSSDLLPGVTHVAMLMCKRTANKVIAALDSLPESAEQS